MEGEAMLKVGMIWTFCECELVIQFQLYSGKPATPVSEVIVTGTPDSPN